jgi:hypothetical protein
MKYCANCRKTVNTNKKLVSIGFADIWNEICEDCGYLIDSGFKHTGDLIFDGEFKIKEKDNESQ